MPEETVGTIPETGAVGNVSYFVGSLKLKLHYAVISLKRLSVEFDERVWPLKVVEITSNLALQGILGQKCLAELGQARREKENLRQQLADFEETKAHSRGKVRQTRLLFPKDILRKKNRTKRSRHSKDKLPTFKLTRRRRKQRIRIFANN
jgi:hypothetical protein